MTWSVVARDAATGRLGVAVTTRAFATGQRCSHVRAGAGALATQSFTNPLFGPRGLRLLAEGVPAADVLRILVAADDGRDIRQLHLVDVEGRAAAFTGARCIGWCGHRTGDGLSVAGNMLAGPDVVAATFDAFLGAAGEPFHRRFLAALDAGQAAGGDKRGKQSAVLLVAGEDEVPEIDLRVDDHAEPLAELRRLIVLWETEIAPFRHVFPTARNFSGVTDLAEIERVWAAGGRTLSFGR